MQAMNTKRLLSGDGSVTLVDKAESSHESIVTLPGNFDVRQNELPALISESIEVDFLSSADGRAFSLPRFLKTQCSYQGRVIATGKINPDQLSYALQCGFDGVVVDEDRWDTYGEQAWLAALHPEVSFSYATTSSSAVYSIWAQRQINSASR